MADEIHHVPATERISPALQGIGGWLLLFCVGVTIIGPLFCLAEILRDPDIVVFDLGLAAFSIYVGITMWRIRSNALKVVKAYFIVTIVLACLAACLAILAPSQDLITSAGRMLIGVAIWWNYFRKSKRVKATFGSNL